VAQGTQDIISFVAVDFEGGNMEGIYQLMNSLYLVDKLFGGFRALGFVILEFFVSESRSGTVEGDSPVGWLDFTQHLEQGAGKALYGIDHFPGLGYGQWRDGVESPVDQSISVEEEQERFFFSQVLNP
jgi:hypothetical protein